MYGWRTSEIWSRWSLSFDGDCMSEMADDDKWCDTRLYSLLISSKYLHRDFYLFTYFYQLIHTEISLKNSTVIIMTSTKFNTLIVAVEISSESLAKLRSAFHTVHYSPDAVVPQKYWESAEVWYVRWLGLPKEIKSVDEIPKTRGIQLSSGTWPPLFLSRVQFFREK